MAETPNPPRENLVRALGEAPQLVRDTNTDGMPILRGHFAVWDTWTEINSAFEGRFMERFAPGAMNKTISEGQAGMRVLFQHGRDPQIGDKPLGTIQRLEPDSTGAYYEVALFDTSYNRDLLPGLEAGVYGASHRFQVMQEDFVKKPPKSEHNPLGLPERTVTEARVREFGPVTWGAYPTATAGVRSLTDEFVFGRFIDEPERLHELLEMERRRRNEPRVTVTYGKNPEDVAQRVLQRIKLTDEVSEPDEVPEDRANMEPDPSEDTTPTPEPEPSEATTRSSHGLFVFVDPPKHLRSK